MRLSLGRLIVLLFAFLYAVSFTVQAGYKSSSYKSSYRSSYKPSYSSSSKSSYSAPKPAPVISSAKPLTSSPKPIYAKPASTGPSSVNKESSNPSDATKPTKAQEGAVSASKAYRSGATLASGKGTISTPNISTSKSAAIPPSQPIPGTSGAVGAKPRPSHRTYSDLEKSAPSENVRTVIRERRGTDWTTLALMYWMLSSNNAHASSLSSDDKAWIKGQIQSEESYGQTRESAMQELRDSGVDTSTVAALDGKPGEDYKVSFNWQMPKKLTAGVTWAILVSAESNGHKQAPECTLKDAQLEKISPEWMAVKWKAPDKPGEKSEIVCKAWGKQERRELVAL